MRGGKRPGAGRPKGSRSVNTLVREARELGLETAGTSLEYLQKVYRGDIRNPDPRRIEAARAAAPYEFPRLTDSTIRTENAALEGWDDMSADEQKNIILAMVEASELVSAWVLEWAKAKLEPKSNVIPLQPAA